MKRLIILLVCIICFVGASALHISGCITDAQVGGTWYRSELKKCNLELTIHNDRFTINTTNPQIYYIVGVGGHYTDSEGEHTEFKFRDKQNRYGRIIFLLRPNYDLECYIQYKDCIIVYIIDL